MKTPQTHDVALVDAAQIAADLILLTLDAAGTPVAGTHEKAGQYTFLKRAGDDAKPFALANAPSGDRLEILVRETADPARWLSLKEHGGVQLAPISGPGYPLDALRGRDVLLLAMGSAIAPIRAALQTICASRSDYGAVALIYGERSEERLAFRDDLKAFEDANVEVKLALSGAQGSRGYVQEALPTSFGANQSVILCGAPPMEKACMAALNARGVAAEHIHRNF